MTLIDLLLIILARGTGIVFIFAGASKIISQESFLITLNNIPWLAQFQTKLLSIFLSCFEIVLGGFLLIGLYHKYTPYISLLTLTFFNINIILLLRKRFKLACSCFGQFSKSMLSKMTIYRNLAIGILTLPLLVSPFSSVFSVDSLIYQLSQKNIHSLIFLCLLLVSIIGLSFLIALANSSLSLISNQTLDK